MKDWIKMYLGVSQSSGKPMYSSVARVKTYFGSMFQGTPKGQQNVLPWFLPVTEVESDETPDILWINRRDGRHLTEKEYSDKFLASSSSDDNVESDTATTD